jgi:hypothetical protein
MGAYRTPGKVGAKSGAGDFSEADDKTDGFKKGGMAKKMHGGYAEGGMSKKVMSSAAKGERPARKSGGSVMSSASSGTPRGKASNC